MEGERKGKARTKTRGVPLLSNLDWRFYSQQRTLFIPKHPRYLKRTLFIPNREVIAQ
jgi:hypothetical protein